MTSLSDYYESTLNFQKFFTKGQNLKSFNIEISITLTMHYLELTLHRKEKPWEFENLKYVTANAFYDHAPIKKNTSHVINLILF